MNKINSNISGGSWCEDVEIIYLPEYEVVKCNLNNVIGLCGNGFTMHDGGIMINETGTYMICGSIYFNAIRKSYNIVTNVQKSVYIRNQLSIEIVACAYNEIIPNADDGDLILYGSVSSGSKIVHLSAGDILYLYGRISGTDGNMYPNNNGSYLTINRLC